MANRYWRGGSGTWNTTNTANWSATSGGPGGASVPQNGDAVFFNASSGAGTVTIASGGGLDCSGIDFTGYSGTITGASGSYINVYSGDIILSSTMTNTWATNGGYIQVFFTLSIRTNGKTCPSILSDVANITLLDNCTIPATGYYDFNNSAILSLNGYTLSCGKFESRAGLFAYAIDINWGTGGKIELTSATPGTNVLNIQRASATAFTGTGTFRRNSSVSCNINFGDTSYSSNLANYAPLELRGSGAVTFNSGGVRLKNLDANGHTGTLSNSVYMSGNVDVSTSTNITAFSVYFVGSGTLKSPTPGVNTTYNTVQVPVAGGSCTLTSNLATNTIVIQPDNTAVFNADIYNVTTVEVDCLGGTLALGSGTWTITGNGVAFDIASAPVSVITGTGTIRMTSALSKTFRGGARTYPTLDNGGAGELIIDGSNTFTTLSNSVQPATFSFTAGTTQTVTNFNISGTSAALVTIQSTSAGSQATLSKTSGVVNATHLSIRDSNATGGATWNAYSSLDVANNLGWVFTNSGQGMIVFF